MRVLDVGCGVGDVSLVVAKLVGRGGEIVGVDLDGAAVRFAEQRLSDAGARFSGIVGDFREVGPADVGGPFDVVCCRLVLQYQADATQAIAAMGRHVRSDGVVVAHEDAQQLTPPYAHPMFPLAEQTIAWLDTAYAGSGDNVQVGGELGWRFTEAGLVPTEHPIVEMVCAQGDSAFAARKYYMLLRSLAPVLVQQGIASEDELDLDTFEERFRAQARAVRSTVLVWPALVGWWARPA
jgi:ubiquinone/menaquinone biosynthesis C-methylase UbiE